MSSYDPYDREVWREARKQGPGPEFIQRASAWLRSRPFSWSISRGRVPILLMQQGHIADHEVILNRLARLELALGVFVLLVALRRWRVRVQRTGLGA